MKFHIWQLMSLADKFNHKNHIATFLSIYFSTILHNIYHKFWNVILIINNGGNNLNTYTNFEGPTIPNPMNDCTLFHPKVILLIESLVSANKIWENLISSPHANIIIFVSGTILMRTLLERRDIWCPSFTAFCYFITSDGNLSQWSMGSKFAIFQLDIEMNMKILEPLNLQICTIYVLSYGINMEIYTLIK